MSRRSSAARLVPVRSASAVFELQTAEESRQRAAFTAAILLSRAKDLLRSTSSATRSGACNDRKKHSLPFEFDRERDKD